LNKKRYPSPNLFNLLPMRCLCCRYTV